MPPLRDIVVGFAFCISLRGPGRVLKGGGFIYLFVVYIAWSP